jgi:hypothetical protein
MEKNLNLNEIDYRADANLAHHVITEIQSKTKELSLKDFDKIISYYFDQLKKEPSKRVFYQFWKS